MAPVNSDIAVVGHLSIDTLVLPSRTAPFVILGGAAAYTSLAAKLLDSKAAVISKVGGNFPEAYLWWLGQEGIDLSGVKKLADEPTTCFELSYSKDLSERTLRLKSKGPTLIDTAVSMARRLRARGRPFRSTKLRERPWTRPSARA